MTNTPSYRGRFAPSPSGDLHFGSLIAALGSYLDAKSNQGQWLLRIEDIDPPREVPGASHAIINTLEQFGLQWDGPIVYQSQRHEFYQHQLDLILNKHRAYGCDCTRKMIMQAGGLYLGQCAHKTQLSTPHSARFANSNGISQFIDRLQGTTEVSCDFATEDFILKRKDGLFAYQLVVVLDDIEQQITDVVRGCDLLEVTSRQLTLLQYLEASPIRYLHLPLAINAQGLKLSKQNHAMALDLKKPKQQLIKALAFLGQTIHEQYQDYTIEQLLISATNNWQISQIPLAVPPLTEIISN